MTQAEYLSLVDYTGRQIRPDKRGTIDGPASAALARLGYRPETWTRQVLAVKSEWRGSGWESGVGRPGPGFGKQSGGDASVLGRCGAIRFA